MLELTLSTGTPSGKFDLKVPTSKLLIKAIITKLSTVSALAAWETACATATATSTRFSQQKGNKTQFEDVSIQDLAELAAQGEGFIMLNTSADNLTVTATFSIELSNNGSVRLNSKDFFTIQFRGFGGFTSFNIYSCGAPVEFDEHLKYSKVACNGAEQVRFNCISAYAIVVPSTLTKLKLNYVNGVTQDIEHDELELFAPDMNEITYLIDGKILPFNKWRAFPLPTADRGEVTLSGVGFIYLLSNKNYEG